MYFLFIEYYGFESLQDTELSQEDEICLIWLQVLFRTNLNTGLA